MDDIVKAAIAKWPNVPHCYGWLSLDARGTWRMHDEQAQALNLKGDPIRNASLNAFINRNYGCDEEGFWYFQNGPQRVYIDLETAPYIAHFMPESGWILHTKEPLPAIDHVYFSREGNLILTNENLIAMVDDRDLQYALSSLQKNQNDVHQEVHQKSLSQQALIENININKNEDESEDDFLNWLENTSSNSTEVNDPFTLTMRIQEKNILVQRSELSVLMRNKNYQTKPKSSN